WLRRAGLASAIEGNLRVVEPEADVERVGRIEPDNGVEPEDLVDDDGLDGGHVAVVVLHLQVRLVPGEAEALVPGDEGGIDGPVGQELAVLDGEQVEGETGLDVAQRDVEAVVELAALYRDARRRRARRIVGERGQASHDRGVREQVELLL